MDYTTLVHNLQNLADMMELPFGSPQTPLSNDPYTSFDLDAASALLELSSREFVTIDESRGHVAVWDYATPDESCKDAPSFADLQTVDNMLAHTFFNTPGVSQPLTPGHQDPLLQYASHNVVAPSGDAHIPTIWPSNIMPFTGLPAMHERNHDQQATPIILDSSGGSPSAAHNSQLAEKPRPGCFLPSSVRVTAAVVEEHGSESAYLSPIDSESDDGSYSEESSNPASPVRRNPTVEHPLSSLASAVRERLQSRSRASPGPEGESPVNGSKSADAADWSEASSVPSTPSVSSHSDPNTSESSLEQTLAYDAVGGVEPSSYDGTDHSAGAESSLGPFTIGDEICAGEHNKVLVALDSSNGGREIVALKLWSKKTLLSSRIARSKLINEIAAFRRIAEREEMPKGSQFLMHCDGVLQDTLHVYMSLELMHQDLSWFIDNNAGVLARNVERWVAHAASAIHALHGMGIIHRNVNPRNLLIDEYNNLRLGDFCRAYITPLGDTLKCETVCSDDFTDRACYFAPEIATILHNKDPAENRSYGPSVDYWALGCVLYEMEIASVDEFRTVLFPTLEDVDAYVKSEQSPGEFLWDAGIETGPLGGLLAGLIRRDPKDRFTFNEVRDHQYFKEATKWKGDPPTSFDSLADDTITRKRGTYWSTSLRMPTSSTDVRRPSVRLPRALETSHAMFDTLGWIDPKGHWGGNSDEFNLGRSIC